MSLSTKIFYLLILIIPCAIFLIAHQPIASITALACSIFCITILLILTKAD